MRRARRRLEGKVMDRLSHRVQMKVIKIEMARTIGCATAEI